MGSERTPGGQGISIESVRSFPDQFSEHVHNKIVSEHVHKKIKNKKVIYIL